jgi:hypothetical protein
LYAKGKRRGDLDSVLPSGVSWSDIGWMLGADKFKIRIRKRQFIAVTKRDEVDITAIISDFIEEKGK